MSEQKMRSRDFEPLRVLGKGAFGVVILVRLQASSEVFAMKVMKKRCLADRNAVNVARVERQVLATVSHPFLVSLRYAFQSRSRLYLVTDYYPGGSLESRLRNHGILAPSKVATVAAQLVLAVEYLHSLGVIHRDVKAANVLFDAGEDAALADFGLAAYCDDAAQRTSFVGTVEYMAPELFRKHEKGYTTAVDWWSLGILIYEMIAGVTPFRAPNPRALFENVLRADLDFGDRAFTDDSIQCIRGLLQRDAAKRADSQTLRHDPFVRDTIADLEVKTPRPSRATAECPSAFENGVLNDDDSAPQRYLSDQGDGHSIPSDLRDDAFAGFAYCHHDDPRGEQHSNALRGGRGAAATRSSQDESRLPLQTVQEASLRSAAPPASDRKGSAKTSVFGSGVAKRGSGVSKRSRRRGITFFRRPPSTPPSLFFRSSTRTNSDSSSLSDGTRG